MIRSRPKENGCAMVESQVGIGWETYDSGANLKNIGSNHMNTGSNLRNTGRALRNTGGNVTAIAVTVAQSDH